MYVLEFGKPYLELFTMLHWQYLKAADVLAVWGRPVEDMSPLTILTFTALQSVNF